MANGNGTNGAIWKVAMNYGVGTAFAAVMLAALMGWIPSPLQTAVAQHAKILSSQEHFESQLVELVRVTRGNCLNDAEDPIEVLRCN